MNDKTVILFGGNSSERRVTVASTQNILEALPEAEAWFISTMGEVYVCSSMHVSKHENAFELDYRPEGAPSWKTLNEALHFALNINASIVLALHGGEGENGSIQKRLEELNIAFTGSGSKPSADSYNKSRSKELVQKRGIFTAKELLIDSKEILHIQKQLETFLSQHSTIVVKPVADGSSFGLHHIYKDGDIPSVARQIAKEQSIYLAEEFVDGIELAVSVLDEEKGPRPLPVSEVRLSPGRKFDFDGKYFGQGVLEITPAEVSTDISRKAQALAVAAHLAVACSGYSRTDLIVSGERCVFIEINNLPGLTKASFIPQQLAAEGTSMREFLTRQINLAQKRQRKSG
ncbi:MAG: ATP-grasp domain-containing protein [Planctomycetes bacterium]|nr:ATP-grasp domain-containing protein [Planctomycetota bacterium]